MARIDYPDLDAPELRELKGRIVAGRDKVLNLYAMLLNSPPVAAGWLEYLSAIRKHSTLAPRLRELLILRVAVLNQANYEFVQHVPFALDAGLTQHEIDALGRDEFDTLTPPERAALAYCDAMTRDIRVSDAVFDALRPHFNARAIVEVTATVAAYNMVSRFLEALQIENDAGN